MMLSPPPEVWMPGLPIALKLIPEQRERSAFAHVIHSVSGTWNSLLKSLPISFVGKELC